MNHVGRFEGVSVLPVESEPIRGKRIKNYRKSGLWCEVHWTSGISLKIVSSIVSIISLPTRDYKLSFHCIESFENALETF